MAKYGSGVYGVSLYGPTGQPSRKVVSSSAATADPAEAREGPMALAVVDVVTATRVGEPALGREG